MRLDEITAAYACGWCNGATDSTGNPAGAPGQAGAKQVNGKCCPGGSRDYQSQQSHEQDMTEAGAENCWDGYKKVGTQPGTGQNKGKRVNKCVKESESEVTYNDDDAFFEDYGVLSFNDDDILDEAEYQGRKVKLGKPMQGDVKKFKVYVKDPKTGNTKKVNFGHGGSSVKGKAMRIRKNNPAARKSFRARHNCDNPGPKTKARYWSCRKW
jgi:hypothetical protein